MINFTESNLCFKCKKPSTKYFCTGCKQYFCPKDFREHEQQLSVEFDDEIVRYHDDLLYRIQNLEESNNFSSDLFDQIEQWKKITIEKVEKTAARAYHELNELINQQKFEITKQLEPITQEIQTLRKEETFVETNIDRLRTELEEVQRRFEQHIQDISARKIIIDDHHIDWNRIIVIQGNHSNREYTKLADIKRKRKAIILFFHK